MVLSIKAEVFRWLVDRGVVRENAGSIRNKDGSIALDPTSSAAFENGIPFSKLIRAVAQKLEIDGDSLPSLDTLKSVATPAAKLYNWNLVAPALRSLSVHIDQDTKALIVAGDGELVAEMIEQLYSLDHQPPQPPQPPHAKAASGLAAANQQGKRTASHGSKQQPAPSSRHSIETDSTGQEEESDQVVLRGIDLRTFSESKPLEDAETCLEFLLLSLCQSLGLRCKQSLGLLSNNTKFLGHLLVKGIKNQFNSIIQWFQDVFANVHNLTNRLAAEPESIGFILSAFCAGLLSRDYEVALWACRLYSRLAQELVDAGLGDRAWEWFVSKKAGLEATVLCFKRHPDTKLALWPVIEQFSRTNLLDLYSNHLRRLIPDPANLMDLIHEFLSPMVESRLSREVCISSGLVDYLLELGIRHSDSGHETVTRISAVSLLVEIWRLVGEKVGEKEDMPKHILSMLTKGTRDRDAALQVSALTNLFKLLDHLASDHDVFAPVVYKSIIFCLIENHDNELIREFVINNLTVTLLQLPTIPVGILVEPLVKQLQVAENRYNVYDFDFFVVVAKHSRISIRHGLLLLDLLGKICLNDPIYGRTGSVPFLILVNRFEGEETLQEYMHRFTKVACAMLLNLEGRLNRSALNSSGDLKEEEDGDIRRTLILEILGKTIHLSHATVNNKIKPLLLSAAVQFKTSTGKEHNGLWSLLSVWGDPNLLLSEYRQSEPISEPMAAVTDHGADSSQDLDRSESRSPVDDKPLVSRIPQRKTVVKREMSEPILEPESLRTSDEDAESISEWPRKPELASDPLARKAQEDIERVRRKRQERLEKERREEERVRAMEEKKMKQLKADLDKRKEAVHKQRRLTTSDPASPNLEIASVDNRSGSYATSALPGDDILLAKLTGEEETVVNDLIKRYRKPLRMLFKAYLNTGLNRNSSFDQMLQNKDTMTVAELLRMSKDYRIIPDFLSTNQISALVRLVKLTRDPNKNFTQLQWDDFTFTLIQISQIAVDPPILTQSFASPRMADSIDSLLTQADLSVEQKLQNLLLHLKAKTKERSANQFNLWIDAELPAGDPAVIEELNRMLSLDPDTPMPEGYRRKEEQALANRFSVPPLLASTVPEGVCISLELIDELIHQALGFHILAPVATVSARFVAEPVRSKPVRPPPRVTARAQDTEETQDASTVGDSSVRGRSASPNRMRDKGPRRSSVGKKFVEDPEEAKRFQKRSEEVKRQLAEMVAEKAAKEQRKQEEETQRRIAESARKKEEEEKEKKRRDESRRKLAEHKEQKRQADEKSAKEMEDVVKKEEEQKKKQTQQQLKVRKEQHQKQLQEIDKARKEKLKEEEEQRKREEELKQEKSRLAEQLLAEGKQKRQSEKQLRDLLNRCCIDSDVVSLLKDNDKRLKQIFEHYAKQTSVSIHLSDLAPGEAIGPLEFVRFGRQFNLIPAGLSVDDSMKAYRQLIHDKNIKEVQYNDFLDLLVRFSILSYPRFSSTETSPTNSLTDPLLFETVAPVEKLKVLLTKMDIPAERKTLSQRLSALQSQMDLPVEREEDKAGSDVTVAAPVKVKRPVPPKIQKPVEPATSAIPKVKPEPKKPSADIRKKRTDSSSKIGKPSVKTPLQVDSSLDPDQIAPESVPDAPSPALSISPEPTDEPIQSIPLDELAEQAPAGSVDTIIDPEGNQEQWNISHDLNASVQLNRAPE
eukprot:GILJ01007045.1.p1 GENE.GILJ01007045.1~~GILJ01007045.1.p1  ORF type:complete len:1707 (-),score=396.78 GILJ01007045.1:173-5251(-)